MSRRAFKPTAEQRGCVETMIGYGVPEAEICLLIKNPETDKPIDLETLRKHFAAEIATGAAKMKLLTSKFIFATILGHDGGLADEEARVRLAPVLCQDLAGLELGGKLPRGGRRSHRCTGRAAETLR